MLPLPAKANVMNKDFNPRLHVLEWYPKAVAVNIGTRKGGNYYNILSEPDGRVIAKGKTSKAAWLSASRHC